MNDELEKTWKANVTQFEALSWHLPRWPEKNHEKLKNVFVSGCFRIRNIRVRSRSADHLVATKIRGFKIGL